MGSANKIKVLIVEAVNNYKRVLREAVEGTQIGQVEHIASNVSLAFERLRQNQIDVVLLDMHSPDMNGKITLSQLRSLHPELVIILFSIDNLGQVNKSVKVSDLSELDYILNLSREYFPNGIEKISDLLQNMFTQIMTTQSIMSTSFTNKHENTSPAVKPLYRKKSNERVSLVVIASSTGGPTALETICKGISADFPIPIIIVQHMPAEFTKDLANSLSKKCVLPVVEAKEGDLIAAGKIMIAPGGYHLTVGVMDGHNKVVQLDTSPPIHSVRPSADVTLKSVANAYEGELVVCVILTGMGSDGKLGVEEIKQKGSGYCIAQSERTCVVYGMPKSVVEAGLADRIEDLESISACIQEVVASKDEYR
ncbi:chemotaxis protein CheB [Paenibacillus sp. GP183]|jgi:two-component system chemotaxis response regulator CheB|uniref:chemotaxis protein CheB n=1 Tax=Paenibacillus sp. GP183 TaxID=1882751 RepID=UPI0008987E65|nr:chemotaxis protein CheB [Paenibacillus sp. GP183]SEB52584.1 two-component system, chemotaxis family, response regulator CheB [Paenibacillus sp. GP183]